MNGSVPQTVQEFMNHTWEQIEPRYQELAARPLTSANVTDWLKEWTRLSELVDERRSRLHVATTQDTADTEAQQRFLSFMGEIYEPIQAADQRLKQKLLDSGLEPEGFEIPLRNLRAQAALFREENLPLQTEEQRLAQEFNRIIGAQTIQWEGEELTIPQLQPIFLEPDRERREQAWRLALTRQLQDREAINGLWQQFMELRGRIAANAGQPDYRAYVWQQKLRFDYTPEDCFTFHAAIEQEVVPAATRIYERRRQLLGLPTLRPWDVSPDLGTSAIPPLHPFEEGEELEQKGAAVFNQVDPVLGGYFDTMRREGLLDLVNRKGKGPGAYCTSFEVSKRPFIFMNGVGVHDDVQTLLHEAGHAFHVFETGPVPYYQQLEVPMEFAEVASMAMELLAAPYLPASEGGFYSEADAARAEIEHLETLITFWPYMAVVDAFQHWVYEHHDEGSDPAKCDAKWAELWQRFIPGLDWSGLEEEMKTGWHRKRHIHRSPFYYVEYGLAQLGAVQVWANALTDQQQAVADYRRALALAGTVTLPELFTAAGARFAFDADTMRQAVTLIERRIEELEQKAA